MLGDDESTHEYAEIPYTRVEWTSDTVSEDIPFTYSALVSCFLIGSYVTPTLNLSARFHGGLAALRRKKQMICLNL